MGERTAASLKIRLFRQNSSGPRARTKSGRFRKTMVWY